MSPQNRNARRSKAAARTSAQDFTLIESKAESLQTDVERFDVATIGRAMHWMATEPTALYSIGWSDSVLLFSSNSAADVRNPWLSEYNDDARRLWSASAEGERFSHVLLILRGTSLMVSETIVVESIHRVRVDDLPSPDSADMSPRHPYGRSLCRARAMTRVDSSCCHATARIWAALLTMAKLPTVRAIRDKRLHDPARMIA